MMPAQKDNEALRRWRVGSWRERRAPEGYAFPGDPRGWEQTRYGRAELSERGEKLLGLRSWETGEVIDAKAATAGDRGTRGG